MNSKKSTCHRHRRPSSGLKDQRLLPNVISFVESYCRSGITVVAERPRCPGDAYAPLSFRGRGGAPYRFTPERPLSGSGKSEAARFPRAGPGTGLRCGRRRWAAQRPRWPIGRTTEGPREHQRRQVASLSSPLWCRRNQRPGRPDNCDGGDNAQPPGPRLEFLRRGTRASSRRLAAKRRRTTQSRHFLGGHSYQANPARCRVVETSGRGGSLSSDSCLSNSGRSGSRQAIARGRHQCDGKSGCKKSSPPPGNKPCSTRA